jgi:hypothetical protein
MIKMRIPTGKKRMAAHTAVFGAAAILALSAWTTPSAQAATAKPKIVQLVRLDTPLVLDDHGNVWCMALNAMQVKDGFYSALMVKARGLDNVASISGNLVLKKDGTVWTIKRIDSAPLNEHVSAELGEQLPHLKHIVKVLDMNMMGMAIDQDGNLWTFDYYPPGSMKDDPVLQYLNTEPKQVAGLDHIKDMTGTTFLKDDGSVWEYDTYVPASRIHSDNPSLYDLIRTTKPVQLKELSDIVKLGYDMALKKDGTVWVWGRGMFAKPADDKTENAVAPFQVEGLSDVTDFTFDGRHALFVKKDGSVWQWGNFASKWDQIGTDAPQVWKDKTRLEGVGDVAYIYSGEMMDEVSTEAAVKKDGTLWMWGADHWWTYHPDPLPVEFRQ